MNLLLLEEPDVRGSVAQVHGRRAVHVLRVLKKGVGDFIKVGVLRKGTCQAEIKAARDDSLQLELGELTAVPAPLVHLAVALPRPKAVSRLVQAAASFNIRSLTFINAWRVEKSYFNSPRLEPRRLFEDACLGCEQGAHPWIPDVALAKRFVSFVNEEVPARFPSELELLFLHPSAECTLNEALSDEGRKKEKLLFFGPEGGFIEEELRTLEAAGARGVRLDTGPLRTEVAVAATLGQLALLQALT